MKDLMKNMKTKKSIQKPALGIILSFAFCLSILSNASGAPRVKTVFDLPYQLESLTGISHKESEVRSYFNNNKLKMPQQGDAFELTSAFLMAEVTYSSLYCNKMIASDMKKLATQRWATRSLDFLKTPHAWSGLELDALFEEFSQLFWQRALDPTEKQIILEAWTQLLIDFPPQLGSSLPVLTSLCSIYLSSPEFLFIR